MLAQQLLQRKAAKLWCKIKSLALLFFNLCINEANFEINPCKQLLVLNFILAPKQIVKLVVVTGRLASKVSNVYRAQQYLEHLP